MNFLDSNYLTDWAKKMTTTGINGMKENDLYIPVIITDLGRGHKKLTMGELVQGSLLEGKEQLHFIVEKNIEEWEILNE